jgi:hypothetical protein
MALNFSGVRVSDSGRRTFVLMARFPRNPKNPTRVALGTYPTMSLADAREKASRWTPACSNTYCLSLNKRLESP